MYFLTSTPSEPIYTAALSDLLSALVVGILIGTPTYFAKKKLEDLEEQEKLRYSFHSELELITKPTEEELEEWKKAYKENGDPMHTNVDSAIADMHLDAIGTLSRREIRRLVVYDHWADVFSEQLKVLKMARKAESEFSDEFVNKIRQEISENTVTEYAASAEKAQNLIEERLDDIEKKKKVIKGGFICLVGLIIILVPQFII
ncbi:hypothetical protein [Halalkalicoccus salilacus]|uniref:hypothetical protein n=1 Tax=Halalkalicoccus salilacus TaxID=3117459 RepID=UPI00300ECC6B